MHWNLHPHSGRISAARPWRPHRLAIPALCLAVLLLASACAPADESCDECGIPEIRGSYSDNFGGTQNIRDASWDDGNNSSWDYLTVNNGEDYLVAQNDANNSYNPSLYSRFDWTTDSSGNLYYCQIAYNAASAADAEATTTANRTNPGSSGCSGFAWTKLTLK